METGCELVAMEIFLLNGAVQPNRFFVRVHRDSLCLTGSVVQRAFRLGGGAAQLAGSAVGNLQKEGART